MQHNKLCHCIAFVFSVSVSDQYTSNCPDMHESGAPSHYKSARGVQWLPTLLLSFSVKIFWLMFQTFCGRRVEIESTPLELTRSFMNPTPSEESKKAQLVVTVSSSKTCWLGDFIHPSLVIG